VISVQEYILKMKDIHQSRSFHSKNLTDTNSTVTF